MPIQPGSLHIKTLELLHTRPRRLTFETLAEELGGSEDPADQITAPWLAAFCTGRIQRPPVDKVQRLYEFLSGKKLLEDETL